MKAADGLGARVSLHKVDEATASVAQQLDAVNNPDPAADERNAVLRTRLWRTRAGKVTEEYSLTW